MLSVVKPLLLAMVEKPKTGHFSKPRYENWDFETFLKDKKFLDDLERQREKIKRRESVGSSDRSPTTSSASSTMIQRAGNDDVSDGEMK